MYCSFNTFIPDIKHFQAQQNPKGLSFGVSKLGYKDSNLEMTESESVALPFGDSPIYYSVLEHLDIIPHFNHKFKYFFKFF